MRNFDLHLVKPRLNWHAIAYRNGSVSLIERCFHVAVLISGPGVLEYGDPSAQFEHEGSPALAIETRAFVEVNLDD